MKINEQYSQLPPLRNSRYLGLISAFNTEGQVLVGFASPPLASTVLSLTRSTIYTEGARPTLANTLQALKQKYGTPSLENNSANTHQLLWLHDRAGNKMASASAEQVQSCLATDNLVILQQQEKAIAECGVVLKVIISTNRHGVEGGGLVSNLNTTLTNIAELLHTAQKTRLYIDKTITAQAESVGAPRL